MRLLDVLGAIARTSAQHGGGERVIVVAEIADAVRRPALEDARTARDAALIEAAAAWREPGVTARVGGVPENG